MIEHRCKNCQWWDKEHRSVVLLYVDKAPKFPGKKEMGFCRKHKPGAIKINNIYFGVQPVMDAEEFCGEFRQGVTDGLPK